MNIAAPPSRKPSTGSSVSQAEARAQESLRRLTIIGATGLFLLFGVMGTWGSVTEISGAVIAEGRIVVESSPKTIQHREGGIVREILVRDGDSVEAGQALVRLDDTLARSELAVIETRLIQNTAKAARLTADFAGLEVIDPPATWHGLEGHPDIASAMVHEQELLEALRTTRAVEKDQLRRRFSQLEEEIRGYEAERNAGQKRLDLVNEELEGLLVLEAQRIVTRSRVSESRGVAAELEGRIGRTTAQIANAGERLHETKLAVVRIDETARSTALTERRQVDAEILELLEQRRAASDAVQRTLISAPRAGVVRALSVHTIGGVIGPGESIMTIVPAEDRLVIEARVRPVDIDQLYPGQDTTVRFPGLNQRVTSDVTGSLIHIDADLTEERDGSEPYYLARVGVDMSAVEEAGDVKLAPGMPAQAFIKTTPRTPLSYLLRPLTDQINRALREG